MVSYLKPPDRLKHIHTLPPITIIITVITNFEDSGTFSELWRCFMSKTSWYWRPKWSTFRDSEVQILSVEWTHEYHQQLGQCAVSWLGVTYEDVCNFKSCVVFGNCSFTHLQEQSHIHFLDGDSGSLRKLGLTGDLLVFASPSSWSSLFPCW